MSSSWIPSHYKVIIPSNFRFPGSLSTNAAIFASVMLASRLQTNMGVFGLTAFAVEWFALFPIFRRHLQVDLCVMIVYYIAKLILFINRILLTLAILRYPLSCFQPRSPCSFTFPKQLCSYTYWESVLLRSSVRHGWSEFKNTKSGYTVGTCSVWNSH
jgi:hypothetical protein